MNLRPLLVAGLVITVTIVALVVAQLMVDEFQVETVAQAGTATQNDTITSWANNTAEALSRPLAVSITSMGNGTLSVGTGNVSITTATTSGSTATVVYGTAAGAWLAGDYWIVYTYTPLTHGLNTTIEGGAGLYELADWLPLIALVLATGVLVVIVIAGMGRGYRRE